MRSQILTSLMLGLAITPAWSARAQEGEEQETETGSETEGAEVMDEAPEPPRSGNVTLPPGAPRGRESAPGEVHSVQEGDTLWDLSQRYLGSPWYWPKVWSYNPEIANPHWIYPGNQVRFFAGGEEVPRRVDEMVVDPGDVDAPTELSGGDLVTVTGKIGYDVAAARPVTTQGFVTQRELDEAGRIEGSSSGALMLSFPDNVYVRFKKKGSAKVGDRYVVFHTTQPVQHPKTGKKLGFLTDFLGTLRVVRVSENVVTAQVVDTWDGMERGDLVGPYGEKLTERIAPRPNTKEVQATVITALVPYLTVLGEHHTVVVDKGSAEGVQLGNTFTILRQGDPSRQVLGQEAKPLSKNELRFPWENIGTCMVTEVKERTSNCLMLRSLEELVPGDRALMRPEPAPSASR
ncbi:LysM peptidoglycan-binding domain-containing protein [Pyxidicoccus xibeiensis]|uniref:LysM peptidoglycan-binding domain-containing protein n=1 Tax=Pyxidicoccus xibeiensis TaxID=2906759 RepID=UPI0020A72D10|nr:LysM domain-containing protein [Pyxidicoccus xibeiensis]MCP3142504.1 LysM peptidoglycan-binding domain-containing protein [Pyxidicoccus xibeiensis]